MNRKPSTVFIIVCTFDPDFDGQAQRIDNELRNVSDLAQQLIRINRPH